MDPKLGTNFQNKARGNGLSDVEIGQETLIMFYLERRGREYSTDSQPMIDNKVTQYGIWLK